MNTLNKNVKWRVDNQCVLICDCKKLVDLKIPLKFKKIIEKFEGGVNKKDLEHKEKLLFADFEKLNLFSNLKIRSITKKEFPYAMKILDKELNVRVRDNNFLFKMFKKFPQFFIGIFLDKEIIGIICGFPRDDYLLISEIVVDSKFHKRGFGKKLVKKFEKIEYQKYKKIHVGAEDNAIGFYHCLGYTPFLLIQYKKGAYSLNDFKKFNILKQSENKGYIILDVAIEKLNLNLLKKLRKNYPKAYFQYIFMKFL
ncbi:MAG: GNAT family N-acetyltransferase [Nanoarchaeota archaeon]